MPKKPGPKLERGVHDVSPSTVSLDDTTRRMARVLGDGDLSRGLRVAARVAYDRYQKMPDSDKARVDERVG